MQLLKITNVPIEYNISTEAARLEVKQAPLNDVQHNYKDGQMNIRQSNIQVRMDSTELRASLNSRNNNDFAHYYGEKGKQTASQTIGENVQFGNQIAKIQDGVKISDVVRQKMLEQPTAYTTFIPGATTEITWEPPAVELNYEPAAVEFNWEEMQNVMNYIPGKFNFSITQYPEVRIEYLGEPVYVPKSADPNYNEEAV